MGNNWKENDHEAGQETGSTDGFFEGLFHDAVGGFFCSVPYNAGYRNGQENPADSSDD